MSLFKQLMAAKFAAKKAAPAVRVKPAPRPKPAPAREAVPTKAREFNTIAKEDLPRYAAGLASVMKKVPAEYAVYLRPELVSAPVPASAPPPPVSEPSPAPAEEKPAPAVTRVAWEFPVAPTPPPAPPRLPSIVVANGKVVARGSCKAISADSGRQCALLAGHVPADVHRHGKTTFVRVAADGQTSFTRRDVLDSAATRGNGITNTGA